MRYIISILLQNESGALARVSGMFAARGYNIESLTVAPTQDAALSRLTLVTIGSDAVIDQIVKQSRKLIDVVEVRDITARRHGERELVLIKLRVGAQAMASYEALCERRGLYRLHAEEGTEVLQYAGAGAEVDEVLAELSALGELIEQVRSGVAAVELNSTALGARVLAEAD